MCNWRTQLKFDPLQPLLRSGNIAIQHFVRQDLLGEDSDPIDPLWNLPEVRRILGRQLANGSWPRAGKLKHSAINYNLIETWRQFRFLVQQFGFTRKHPGTERSAEYLFSCQTKQGDIRGMLANQYATYYTGAIMALLIQAGYENDPRILRGFEWLLGIRQSDNAWSVPIITHHFDRATMYRLTSEYAEPVEPDRSKPFSHNATGMVIRAFAAHPTYRRAEAAVIAAQLLKSRFFQQDSYTSYRSADYWTRFQYPFWWNNLVAALDSVTLIGASMDDEQIERAVLWLRNHQLGNGLWDTSYSSRQAPRQDTDKKKEMRLWVSLAVCRVLRRLFP